MAAIIEFRLRTEKFALEETLNAHPEAHIEIERVVADDPDQITPYIWARTDDFDAFEATLEDDPTVEDVTMFSETEEERSYQMAWMGSVDFIIHILTDNSGIITHADGSAAGWNLRIVFPDREALSQAYNAIEEAGFQSEVYMIYRTEDPQNIQYGLTEIQWDTLVAAFEAGYFTVPREVTLTELAEEHDSSPQALSQRLRRATDNLIESMLITHSHVTDR